MGTLPDLGDKEGSHTRSGSSTTVSDTLGEGTTEYEFMILSGYSSLILEIRSVPIPDPVPPPREWVSWNPWSRSQPSDSFLTTSSTLSCGAQVIPTPRTQEPQEPLQGCPGRRQPWR